MTARGRRPPSLYTLIVVTALGALATNLFLPSLDNMARAFGVSYGVMQIAISGYLAASAVIQLFVGPMADRYGRRPVMLASLGVFVLASIGTLLATSAWMFLIFRLIQAAAMAGTVLARAMISDLVAERAAAMLGYVTMGMALVPMLAPVAGGRLEALFGWRGSFVLLLITGVVITLWAWRDLGETMKGPGIPLAEQWRRYPLLARSVRFWGYCLAAMLNAGSFYAYLGGASFVGAQVFRLDPVAVGNWFGAPSLGYMLGNAIAARLSGRFSINAMILTGSAIAAAALTTALLFDLSGHLVPIIFFGAVSVMGLGNGMTMPNAMAGMMGVRPDLAGTASGFGGAMMVGGGAMLATLAGMLLVPGSGAAPLLAIMAASGCGAVAAILWVIHRDSRRPG